MEKATLASNVSLQFNETKTWYIAVWLDEINDDQREMDKGDFGGTVTFEVSKEETWETTSMMVDGNGFHSVIHQANGSQIYDEIIFTDINAPDNVTTTDLTVVQDGSIVGWYDNISNTYYVSSQEKGTKILFNEDYAHMFEWCTRFDQVSNSYDFTNVDTSEVVDMNNMFYGYVGTTLDLSTFDTSNVTNMNYMFDNCENLTTLILGGN